MTEVEEVVEEQEEEENSSGFLRSISARGKARVGRMVDRLDRWSIAARKGIPALDLFWEFFARFKRLNGTVLVGHIAYRTFVWLAPMMLVLAAGLGFSTETFDVVRYAQDMGVSADTAEDAVTQAETSRVTALVVGLPALAFATWSLIRGMHYAYSQVWEVEIKTRKGTVRASLITMVLAVGVAIFALFNSILQRQGPLFAAVGWVGSLVFTAGALWLICWAMPCRTERWIELLPGPIFGAIGLSAIHVFTAIYLPGRIASASVLYGSIGVALAVLFFVFLLAYLLVIAPFMNAVWVDRWEILGGRPWVSDADAAPRWARGPLRRLMLYEKGPED